jgi:hypothetical protein
MSEWSRTIHNELIKNERVPVLRIVLAYRFPEI